MDRAVSKKDYRSLDRAAVEALASERMTPAEIVAELRTNADTGLSPDEVVMRQALFGLNSLRERPKDSLWSQILEQFTDPMVQLLLAAGVISFVISMASGAKEDDALPAWLEPLVIGLILIFNALVGVLQDYRAEKSVDSLKRLQSKKSLALRSGEWNEIDAAFLVPGDILKVRVGDVVPADSRVLKVLSSDLRVDEAIITGESREVPKNTESSAADPKSCVLLSGTTVIFGLCIAVVVQTGNATVLGNILTNVEEATADTKDDQSPLRIQLNEFGAFLAKAIGAICLVIWILNAPKFFDKVHGNWVLGALYYFKQAVALGVAAIPEGLPAVITTCLSLGTIRMAKRNALVVKLAKVETLGCTTVICADKTGTLTQNKMLASRLVTVGPNGFQESIVTGQGYAPKGTVEWGAGLDSGAKPHQLLALSCVLNNEARIVERDGTWTCIGLPTEGSLLALAAKMGANASEDFDSLFTLSFSSARKRMSVLVRNRRTGRNQLLSKGNPNVVLKSCSEYMGSDGRVAPVDAGFLQSAEAQVRALADRGLRVLAVAYKDTERLGVLKDLQTSEDVMSPAYRYLKDINNYGHVESELTFLGLIGISDPVRPEAKPAIQTARTAGIAVFMITGDISETAVAIARDLELVAPDTDPESAAKGPLTSRSLFTPADFDLLSAGQRKSVLQEAAAAKRSLIFARATPAFKRVIVKSLTGMGHVVAMTGDGVNDAPALKQASIGVAMGLTGTEVAREASDLILLDDNFSTIVGAVEEGRAIFANMKAFIRYMISSNIGEVVSILLQSVLGIPEAFNSIQLLWVNLVTDGLPATALSFNPVDADVMTRPPRKADDRIVDSWTLKRYIIIGTYVGLATVGIFIFYYTGYAPPGSVHTHVSFNELRNWTKCEDWRGVVFRGHEVDPCSYFIVGKRKASSLSLTVLTIIEMFNALNALSENQSLFKVGLFANPYLLQAIALSIFLHCLILYIPFLNDLFSVTPLTLYDWLVVVAFSLPVVAIDETLKAMSRKAAAATRIKAD